MANSARMSEIYFVMNLSSLTWNGIQDKLKMKYTQVENTIEEETIIAAASHVVRRVLENNY